MHIYVHTYILCIKFQYTFVHNSINNPEYKNRIDISTTIQKRYTELTNKGEDITITWIPSRQGISRNELANTSAKPASESQGTNNQLKVVLPDK